MTMIGPVSGSSAPRPGPAPVSKGAPAPKGGGGGSHPAAGGGGVGLGPLNANQLLQAAKAEAASTTAGPLQQLAQQIAAQNAQNANATKAVGGYFQGLGNYVNQNMGALDQVGTNLNNTLGQLSQSEQGQLQGITNNSAALMNQYLPKGDADVGSAGMQSLIGNMAQQQGYAAQDMGALQGAAATGQANYQDLARALAASDASAGRQDLANIQLGGAAKIAPLATKYSALVDKQGNLAESDLYKLRQQEITNNLGQEKVNATNNYNQGRLQLAADTLGQKAPLISAQAQADAAKGQAALQNARTSWKNANTAASKAAATAAYQQAMSGAAQTRANTSASEAPYINALHQAEANLKNVQAKQGPNKPLGNSSNNVILSELGGAVARAKALEQQGVNPQKISEALSMGATSTSGLTLNGKPIVGSNGQQRYSVSHVKGLGNPALVQAALELSQTGAISHGTWVQLHQMGVHSLPFKVAPPKGK